MTADNQPDELPELTDRQKEFIDALPASTGEIAEKMRIRPTSVEDHRNAVENKGVDLSYDPVGNQWWISDDRKTRLRRISTKHKTTKTREANELIEESETVLLRRLRRNDPLEAPPRGRGDASLLAIFSDAHFGDLVEDEHGNILYDMESAAECVETYTRKTLRIAEDCYEDLGDCHLALLGDIATGEGIYEGQVHDIEAHLADQVTLAVQSLFDMITTFADYFDTLQIHCVMGNHGEVRASGVSKQANTDLIVYRWLDDALRREGLTNVTMEVAEATHHLNTKVRGWNLHLRHGQDGKRHVDKTRSSESEWRGWRDAHQYDMAARGHWHNPSVDYVLNRYPVYTAPSPKPGSSYIERLGSPDVSEVRSLGWLVGVDDDRPAAFSRLVDDR